MSDFFVLHGNSFSEWIQQTVTQELVNSDYLKSCVPVKQNSGKIVHSNFTNTRINVSGDENFGSFKLSFLLLA